MDHIEDHWTLYKRARLLSAQKRKFAWKKWNHAHWLLGRPLPMFTFESGVFVPIRLYMAAASFDSHCDKCLSENVLMPFASPSCLLIRMFFFLFIKPPFILISSKFINYLNYPIYRNICEECVCFVESIVIKSNKLNCKVYTFRSYLQSI